MSQIRSPDGLVHTLRRVYNAPAWTWCEESEGKHLWRSSELHTTQDVVTCLVCARERR